ncbi:hypothetical protein MTO96_016280 [Rhipicephalus appendiculatus]
MYEVLPLGAALSEQRNHACVDAERQYPVIVPAINPDATAATSLLFGHVRRLQPPSDFSGQDRSHCASMAKTRQLFAPQALLPLVTCFVIDSHPASQHVRGSPLGAALSEQRNHACVDAERQYPVIVPAINPDATAATSLLFGHVRRLQPPSDFSGQDRSHCASMAKTRQLFAPQALLPLVTCFVIDSHPASQHVRGSPLGAALSDQRNHACVDAERQYPVIVPAINTYPTAATSLLFGHVRRLQPPSDFSGQDRSHCASMAKTRLLFAPQALLPLVTCFVIDSHPASQHVRGSPLGAALSEQRNHACVDAERQYPVIVPAINPDPTAATSLLFGHVRRLQPPSDFSGQDRSHCASMAKTRLLFAPQALLPLVTCFVIDSHPASQHVRGSPLGCRAK